MDWRNMCVCVCVCVCVCLSLIQGMWGLKLIQLLGPFKKNKTKLHKKVNIHLKLENYKFKQADEYHKHKKSTKKIIKK